jgi:predicted XRE-type DNA-binding protein
MSKQVFTDLGFSEDEAREQAIRADIAAHISVHIEKNSMRQRDAAKLFRVPQPTISKIVSGNLANLSLAYLIKMLIRADLPFSVVRSKATQEVDVAIGDDVSISTNFEKAEFSQVTDNFLAQDVTLTGQG